MDTFTHLKRWLNEIQNEASNNAIIFLVANKKDKEADREVDQEKGQQFVKQNGLHGFFETSARSGENVEKTFMTAAQILFKQHYRTIREQQLKQTALKSGVANKRLKAQREST